MEKIWNWIGANLLSSVGFWVILIFAVSGAIIHFRGKWRHGFVRQLFDHSTFFAPINILMYLFSRVPGTPYLATSHVPGLQLFRDNWEILKKEALALEQANHIKGSDKYNDAGFNSFFRRGWKRFYIKWYGDYHKSAVGICPETINLVKQVPEIKAAMFVVLPAGSKLLSHRDPYAGSLRYHLGLITPNDDDCYINVDGQKYSWRDGEDVLFDETYIHHARNNTDKDRLIFFCDVRRPMKNRVGEWLNNFFSWLILSAGASPNDARDRTGNINKFFGGFYQIRLVGKKLKSYNKVLYQFVKFGLIFLIIYLVFFL